MKEIEISVTVKFVGNYNLKERSESVLNILTSGMRGEVTQISAIQYGTLPYGVEQAKEDGEE